MQRVLTTTAVALSAVAGLVGCGDANNGGITGSQPEYVLCDGPPGTWTDLTDEETGRRESGPIVIWTDEDGCAIRLDTIFHRFGDDHCGWEDVEYLSLGVPIGEPFSGPDATPPVQDWEPLFLFNTDGAVANLPAGERLAAADVPEDALDIGAKTVTGRRRHLSADELTVYEVQGDDARAFVATADGEVSCA